MRLSRLFTMFAAVAALGIFGTGCESLPPEEPIPVDIELGDLLKRMNSALDPSGSYAKADSYIQRQLLRTDRFLDDPQEEVVELQFEKPSRFRLTTYRDQEPVTAWIVNGDSGWIVNYSSKRSDIIRGKVLAQMKALTLLATPDSSLEKVFSKIDLTGCRIDSIDYYKLSCRNPGDESLIDIYVGKQDFLIHRIYAQIRTAGGSTNSLSTIRNYELRDGVMIPVETDIKTGSAHQTSQTIFYQLDAEIPPEQFMPPTF